jgi:hypothetical protein
MAPKKAKRWSQSVTEKSNALDLVLGSLIACRPGETSGDLR